jgi:carbonic anhydrase/acetyltransferase-like protein (isoleucine patch superfamily)
VGARRADCYFGERATVHIADAMLSASIGNDVTVGRFALVHACTVEDRVVVGDAALVMDDAHVGAGSLITAGSLVPPRKRLAGGWIYSGYPVTPVREIGAAELAEAAAAIRHRAPSALVTLDELPPLDMEPYAAARELDKRPAADRPVSHRSAKCYVAPNALVAGAVDIADDASVYFGCAVVAGDGRISIGPRTNVQDNSLLVTDAARGPLILGADVTIGTQRPDGLGDDRGPRVDRDGLAGRRWRRGRGRRMHRRARRGLAGVGHQGRMDLGGPAGVRLPPDQARRARDVRQRGEGLRTVRRRLSIEVSGKLTQRVAPDVQRSARN